MRNITLVQNLPFSVPAIDDITDQLPKKHTWEDIEAKKWTVRGKWDGKTYLHGFRKETDINRIVVHHSGSPEGTLASHASYHAGKWGAGIAYHIAIDNGKIHQCNDLLSMTYHAGNNNTDSIGIVVNRDLTKKDLTDDERRLLYAAILTVKSIFKITEVIGHNECCPTQCPGTNMARIRTEIGQTERAIALSTELEETPNTTTAQVFAAYTRFSDLYALANKEGPNKAEAQRKIMKIVEIMKTEGIMNTGA